jgi:hypothetical protein
LPKTLAGCHAALQTRNGLPDTQSGGPELPLLIRRIRSLMDEGARNTGGVALETHTFAKGIICTQQNTMLHAMARPGMANLVLGGKQENLLSAKKRLLKKGLKAYKPSEEYIDGMEDTNERQRVRSICERYDTLESTAWGAKPSSA